jgi:hypothetical protein
MRPLMTSLFRDNLETEDTAEGGGCHTSMSTQGG